MGFDPFSLITGALGSIFGGGGGSSTSPLSNFLAGQIGSQRIPGQTTSGEYTPPAGGFGTYNYIPTGAPQLDPALIAAIQSGMGANNAATGFNAGAMNPSDLASYTALNNYILSNPGGANYINMAEGAGGAAAKAGAQAGDISGLLAGNATSTLSDWQTLLGQYQNNPFSAAAMANAAGVGGAMGQAGQSIGNVGQNILGQQNNLTSLYSSLIPQIMNNPFNSMAQTGAMQAGQMASGAGQNAFDQGARFSGQAAANLPAAQAILNMGFDPQQQLYDKTANNLQNQLGSYLANTGLTGSGAGAGIVSDALQNFNMNWQNNQLGRALQGLQGFNQGMSGIGSDLTTGQGLQQGGAGSVAAGSALPGQTFTGQTNTQLGQLGQLGGGFQTGAGLASTGAGLLGTGINTQAAGNTYAANTFNNLLQPQQSALQGLTSALPGVTSMFGAATDQGAAGSSLLNQAGALPYNAFNTMGNTMLGGINSYLGNAGAGSNLNNVGINNILNYLNAVSRGSQIAGSNASGAQGNQMTQNGQAAGALSPLINGGLSWLSNQFGGGGSSIFNNPALFQY